MMGRPPLPTHIKLVKGTARPHRLNPNEPKLCTPIVERMIYSRLMTEFTLAAASVISPLSLSISARRK